MVILGSVGAVSSVRMFVEAVSGIGMFVEVVSGVGMFVVSGFYRASS